MINNDALINNDAFINNDALMTDQVSERVPAGDDVNVSFVSTFLDTILQCNYSKGEVLLIIFWKLGFVESLEILSSRTF